MSVRNHCVPLVLTVTWMSSALGQTTPFVPPPPPVPVHPAPAAQFAAPQAVPPAPPASRLAPSALMPAPTSPAPLAVEPARAPVPPTRAAVNQKVADAIAANLRQSAQLRHYSVDIVYLDGVAELTGQVSDQHQRDEILRIAQGVPGVERVHDRLVIAGASAVRPVQAVGPPPLEMGPAPKREPDAGMPPEPTPIFQAFPGMMPNMGGQAGMPPNPAMLPNPATDPPRMPPNAWPTYAPYNNYSRVAYPTLYPYNAWPFIGPFYPFPKIPPGWRSVQLKWNDGYWWYGKNASGHDWWRIRYR